VLAAAALVLAAAVLRPAADRRLARSPGPAETGTRRQRDQVGDPR